MKRAAGGVMIRDDRLYKSPAAARRAFFSGSLDARIDAAQLSGRDEAFLIEFDHYLGFEAAAIFSHSVGRAFSKSVADKHKQKNGGRPEGRVKAKPRKRVKTACQGVLF